MKQTLVVNLFGGPGTGKSTTMSRLFAELKDYSIDCEIAPEYAKEIVWEESHKKFDSQFLIFGKQYHRIKRLYGKVDVIITDCPLLNFILFTQPDQNTYRQLIIEEAQKFQQLNVFLKRVKAYNPNGRYQTEDEAKAMDQKLLNLFKNYSIEYEEFEASKNGSIHIFSRILTEIGRL